MAKWAEAVQHLYEIRPEVRRSKKQVRKRWDNMAREAKQVMIGEKSDPPSYVKKIIDSNILNQEFPKIPDEELLKIIEDYKEKKKIYGESSEEEDSGFATSQNYMNSGGVSTKVEATENSGFDYSDYLEDNAFEYKGNV